MLLLLFVLSSDLELNEYLAVAPKWHHILHFGFGMNLKKLKSAWIFQKLCLRAMDASSDIVST